MAARVYKRRLTDEQVRAIRKERDIACTCCGMMPSFIILGKRYGISHVMAFKIYHRANYADVPDE